MVQMKEDRDRAHGGSFLKQTHKNFGFESSHHAFTGVGGIVIIFVAFIVSLPLELLIVIFN